MPNTTEAVSRLSLRSAAPVSAHRRGRSAATVTKRKRAGTAPRIHTRRAASAAARGEKRVERRDYLRALTDGRSDSLDRSRSRVADREDALHASFQRPATALQLLVAQRFAGA
jgi:hypothetical protein